MHLPLQLALSPAELALPLARRLPSLKLIAIAPHQGPQLNLQAPGVHVQVVGMVWSKTGVWKVSRSARWQTAPGEDQEQHQVAGIVQIASVNV